MAGHFAKIEDSNRLQRVFNLLLDMQAHSTREIERGADVSATSSACSEIRRNLERNDLPSKYRGYRLPDSKFRMTKSGKKAYTYQLEVTTKGQMGLI